jgi:hypothetical protein
MYSKWNGRICMRKCSKVVIHAEHTLICYCFRSFSHVRNLSSYILYMTLHPAVSFQNFEINLNTKISLVFYQCARRIHADIRRRYIHNLGFNSVRKKTFLINLRPWIRLVLSFPYICTFYTYKEIFKAWLRPRPSHSSHQGVYSRYIYEDTVKKKEGNLKKECGAMP